MLFIGKPIIHDLPIVFPIIHDLPIGFPMSDLVMNDEKSRDLLKIMSDLQ